MDTQFKFNPLYITGISLIAALGGYLFGFDFAVIAGALPFLKEQFGFNAVQEGLATATLALGCILGCLIAGTTSDRFGRKKGLVLAAAIFFFSSLAMSVSHNSIAFIAARFTAGMGVGMASVVSPLYIAEIAPNHMRGKMVSINQLMLVVGILVTNFVNYSLRNEGVNAWRWMVGLGAVPSLLFLIGVRWLPESPRWLVKVGSEDKAVRVLSKISNARYAEHTISSVKDSLRGDVRVSYASLFKNTVLPAVLVGIGLAVFQQLCGINVIFNYTARIFESVGFNQDDQLKQMVFIGLVNLVCTVMAMWLVDKVGRKPLMLLGAIGLLTLYIISAVLLQTGSPLASWTLLGAIGIYAMSLAPVTWVLISEIFPNRIRATATSAAVIALWLSYAVLTFTFPVMAKNMGTYTPFYIYAAICFLGFFFIKYKVKETKGRTLEELESIMTK